ncbi:hypothetical protein N657DRAFT_694253 [Parathielavia appendiculata]|uniref:Uncharacterized protein n=1 Tax=Parathielavia appendiculata TaxID=2587402 RepID=A0AAN6YYA4_9PEZI|nr:hypothetical protein N657DRAFT_694253 [Parathielavia appendiculata]
MPHYKTSYENGQGGLRHPNLPPFEFDEQGQINVWPCEIYRRFDILPGTLCFPYLKTHKKNHKTNGRHIGVESQRRGPTTSTDQQAALGN